MILNSVPFLRNLQFVFLYYNFSGQKHPIAFLCPILPVNRLTEIQRQTSVGFQCHDEIG